MKYLIIRLELKPKICL